MKIDRLIGIALVWVLASTMHAQSYKVLANFSGQPSGPIEPGLIAQSRGGYMLTTAPDPTTDGLGVAFRVTTSGALTVLHQFDPADGISPAGGLTLGRNGRFYGTTYLGGTNGYGTIFEMTPDGIVKTLHDFAGASDGHPQAPPIQSLYGDFYGTTYGAPYGSNNDTNTYLGTVYKIDSSGNYTLLHTFTGQDGANPVAPLVQDATNYWFYGIAENGGPSRVGTIFRISSSGEFEVVYNFDELPLFDESPYGFPVGLIQANDGNFYGVTNLGSVFKMTPTRQVTVLHQLIASEGFGPLGGFIQASDGYLYGIAGGGGVSGGGVLFRISTTGDFTVLHNFEQSTGSVPVALIQHTNGFLYGDTEKGGSYDHGVFYRFDLGLPPFVTFLNSYGRVGMTVQILGEGFTTDSQVFFNGVPAQITEVEPTYMRAVVPEGATSGWITVTTTKGTLKSNKVFLVRP